MVKKIYREDREARESLTIEAVDRKLSAAIYDGALSSDGEPNDDGEGVIAAERDDAVLQVVAEDNKSSHATNPTANNDDNLSNPTTKEDKPNKSA
ncbi:hypothetical protein DPSP01_011201 [Paraphaeosphaeria sporulosa]